MSKSTISTYELSRKFPTPDAAREYMEQKRWNGEPSCPSCGVVGPIYKLGAVGYYRCPGCKLDFTVRTGTIMERSHIPLDKWLLTMYLLTTARKGISSLQLAKELGITQKSAWFLLHRIREACGKKHDDDDQNGFLCGIVEADEAYLGGKESNKHESKKLKAGRGAVGKLIEWAKEMFGYRVEVVKRNQMHKFQVLPKRWIVERTFAWLTWSRRLSKDYELRHTSAETMTYIAFAHQLLRRSN